MNERIHNRNNSIDIFRCIFAVIVVAIHVDIFVDINQDLFLFFTKYFLRFVMPFFLLTSGFYYIKSMLNGKITIRKRIKEILTIYILWSIIYYIISFVDKVIIFDYSIKTFLLERVVFLFFNGSYYHLWYIPALLYSIIAITLVFKLFGEKGIKSFAIISIVLYLFGVFGSAYYDIGSTVKIFKFVYDMESFSVIRGIFCVGFPYFSLGYFVIKLVSKYSEIIKRICKPVFLITLLASFSEIYILIYVLDWIERPYMYLMLYPFTAVLFMMLLMNPMSKFIKAASYCKKQSNFFYFSHPLFILAISTVANFLGFHINTIVLFFASILAISIAGHICIKSNNKILKKLIGESYIKMVK